MFFSGGEWVVWDPQSDAVTFRLDADDIGPTHGNRIAWCDRPCRSVHITDVVTGSQQTVDPPEGFGGFDVSSGTFSPVGTTLAVPVRREADVGELVDQVSELQLALVDVATGDATIVESSRVAGAYNFVEWASSGQYVFFTGGQENRSIIVYRMGEERARLLPVKVGDFYGAAAI